MKPGPVRLLSTTWTPSAPVASRISSPNLVWRLSNTCSTPSDRRYDCLGALVVAKTSAPAAWANCTAANPTPPVPAWIKTRSPAFSPARSNESKADAKTVGNVASAAGAMPEGARTTNSSVVTASEPSVPNPSPTTRSPTETVDTSAPTSTTRPQNSSPSRPSPMTPRERNMSKKLSPAASTATRTSRSPNSAGG